MVARRLRFGFIDLCLGMAQIPVMNETRVARLFRIGFDQAVCIPREFELPGEHAIMRKAGNQLIIEPAEKNTKNLGLIEFLKTLEPIDEPFPEIEDPPPEPVDL
jgi:antitoxin VapB